MALEWARENVKAPALCVKPIHGHEANPAKDVNVDCIPMLKLVASKYNSDFYNSDDQLGFLMYEQKVLKCANCGLAVTEDHKLPVRDEYDPFVGHLSAKIRCDWIRIPKSQNKMLQTFDYFDLVACTPGCVLSFLLDGTTVSPSMTPALVNFSINQRHGINISPCRAPNKAAFAYTHSCTDDTKTNKK